MFVLDPRLAADTFPIGRLGLCRLRLMNDATYPWCILVPARPGTREIFELDAGDRTALIEEVSLVGRAMAGTFAFDKLNVAALGNVVAQLHVHLVGRRPDDPAWPAPVWGRGPSVPYADADVGPIRSRLAAALGDALHPDDGPASTPT